MKYRFINEHRHEFRIAAMCRVLRVARAGFYAWLHNRCLIATLKTNVCWA